jgi:polyribonucleotide nucleotidyltransferase
MMVESSIIDSIIVIISAFTSTSTKIIIILHELYIGCVRIGYIKGVLKVDPTIEEMKTSSLDLVYAGNSSRPLMIETIANQIDEKTMKEALRVAQIAIQDIIATQLILIDKDSNDKILDNGSDLELAAAKKMLLTKSQVCMYIYIHIYTYIYTYIHTYIYVYI